MALVYQAATGGTNPLLNPATNSYVTLTEAEAYFENRINQGDWESASVDNQERALVSAWRLMEGLRWAGRTGAETQPHMWPREAVVLDNLSGRTIELDGDETAAPQEVKDAQFELAYHLLQNPEVLEATTPLSDFRAGSLSVGTIRTLPRIPGFVYSIARPYVLQAQSRGTQWFWSN